MPKVGPDSARKGHSSRAQSFPRCARLTRPSEFRWVFAQASRVSDQAFTVLARPRPEGSTATIGPRLGLAIAKKCAKRAVSRQRVKRLVRESFRKAQHELPDVDIVVMCRPPVTQMTNRQVYDALDKLWQRLKRQCATS